MVEINAGFEKVISARIVSEEYKAFSPNSCYFPDSKLRKRLKKICKKYGNQLYPGHPLGYEDSQSLFVFPHNVPNNTLPIIWAGPDSESAPGRIWRPLWKRVKVLTQPPQKPDGKPQPRISQKPEITDKKQEMQQNLSITNSPGTTVIQGNGNIINTSLPTTEKKPLRELFDKLAKRYDEELKKSLE
ncbi:MAG: hypothetical protein FJ264_17990 [Planctomycetes bacterium]|nr:hypothetical protein [Planctomycetota bacterium]